MPTFFSSQHEPIRREDRCHSLTGAHHPPVWPYQNGPLALRYAPDFRQDSEELCNNVLVTASNGAQISLGQVADLGVVMGPSMISSANGLLQTIRLSGNLGTLRGR